MGLLFLGISLVLLLALNGFFVVAEFAIVKVRSSRVTQLEASGDARATWVAEIQSKLDEYLSVCQVGITLASIALGMVGERSAEIIMGGGVASRWRYVGAMVASYVLISGSHILLGELVPKSIAIRAADRAALFCARPLKYFHFLFFPALWLLTTLANALLRMLGFGRNSKGDEPEEEELRIILDESQERGVMSFRRLLFMENVFDLGRIVVRDTMRQRSKVRALDARLSWTENLRIIQDSRFTRYPLLTHDSERPKGFVHLKDLIVHTLGAVPDLQALARPLLATTEETLVEVLFAEMQRRRIHVALVTDQNSKWTGFVTLEDIIEELVGSIRDEFDDEEPIRLIDTLTADRVQFDIEAESPTLAFRNALSRLAKHSVPLLSGQLLEGVEGRIHLVGTYVGNGIAIPHARVTGLGKPMCMILRSNDGVSCDGTVEKAHLLFVLLTPAGQPRVHQRLLAIIAGLLHESEYVKDRLMTATSSEDVLETIRTGEQAALD